MTLHNLAFNKSDARIYTEIHISHKILNIVSGIGSNNVTLLWFYFKYACNTPKKIILKWFKLLR